MGFPFTPSEEGPGVSAKPQKMPAWVLTPRPGKTTVSAGAKLRSALRKHPFFPSVLRLVNLVAIRAPSLSTWSASMKTKRTHSAAECRETSEPCRELTEVKP